MSLIHHLSDASLAPPDGGQVLQVAGIAFGAVLTFLAAVLTLRGSQRANARTVAVTERQADTAGFGALVTALQAEVKRLGERVESLEQDREVDRAARRAAEDALAAERVLRAEERRGRLDAVGAYRDVRELLRHSAPEVPIPPPPASVEALL